MALPPVPDRFQALEELARGETGTLVRARDKTLLREVVLKLPPGGSGAEAPDAQDRERMLREGRALARVQHRAIVRLLDVIESPAGPVLVLEPATGESLAELLARETRLESSRVRRLALELADALAAVHAVGVIHRGITLDQILVGSDGNPQLSGFGFAKFSSGGASLPGTTFLYKPGKAGASPLASPPHPAPEQIAGERADARSDLFGLGWVLYECLTGEEPYPIELDVAFWKTPKDPRALAPGTQKDLSEVVLRCLAISPSKRFPSAVELRNALARESAPASAQVAAPVRAGPPRRRPLVLGAGMLLVGCAGWFGWRWANPPVEAGTRGPGPAARRNEADKQLNGAPYGSMHAVVIGIDEYEHWPKLTCAVADAKAVAGILEQRYGFAHDNIKLLLDEDATYEAIQTELGGTLCQRTAKEDGVLVFFAGHGQTQQLPDGGEQGYLVPVGGETKPELYMSTLIQMDDVDKWSRLIPAKHVFFVLDACFGGLASTRGLAAASASTAPDHAYIGYLARKKARLMLSAGGKDEEVNEDPRIGHSYFTNRLLKGLGEDLAADYDHDGMITAMELASYLQSTVRSDTAGLRTKQNPRFDTLRDDDEGQFLFLPPKARGLK